ncbi:MAG: MBL fold metallo-hydrolase, partial [Actinomycetota bacterium]|nr:MBL fold metallo-hydrolase [Actinomycetota bacterium]
MRVTFCGVRGSTPAAGPDFVRYGGHTSCVAVAPDGGRPSLLLDGGTGLMRVTEMLGATPFDGTLLLGHLHWDHTHGIPFFKS